MIVEAGELHTCGATKKVVVTNGPGADGAFDGYCAACFGTVFGTILSKEDKCGDVEERCN
jgi:hypothetical protein